MKFLDLFNEGIQKKDDDYIIDKDDYVDDIISFSNKLSYVKGGDDDLVMVGLPLSSEEKSKFLFDLKTNKINKKIVNELFDKIIDNLSNDIDISSFDYVLTPKSTSFILSLFLKKLKTKHPNITTINDMFVKNSFDKIIIDVDRMKADNRPSKYIKKLFKRFNKVKENIETYRSKNFKIRPFNKYERKYLKNFIKLNEKHFGELENMVDKKILIIDDVFTTGTTLNEMKLLLKDIISDKIFLFSLFI
jgi:uracil phosphoribosyltransferase